MTKKELYGGFGVVALTSAAGLLLIAWVIDRNVNKVNDSINALPGKLRKLLPF